MKKLLSVIVTVAMLVSCFAPSLVVFAADEPALVIAEATFDPAARDANVKTTVSVANNPGFYYGAFYLYYDNAVLDVAEGAVSSLMGDDYTVTVTYGESSTTRSIKKVLDAAGVATGDNIDVAIIEVEGDDNYTASELVDVVLTVVPGNEYAEGAQITYGVVAGEVVDADENEVAVASAVGVATAQADPNTPVYENKTYSDFTIYVDTVSVNKGVSTVEVGVGFGGTNENYAQYGTNGANLYVLFPEELSIVSARNGIFETTDGVDVAGVTNVADRFPDDIKKACDNVGFDYSGFKGNWVNVMLNSDDVDYRCKGEGYIAYITFEVPTDKIGTYDIAVVASAKNVYYVDNAYNPIPLDFTVDNGAIKVAIKDCKHENTTTTGEASTCKVAGWSKTVCDVCEEVLEDVTLPLAEHIPGEQTVTKAPSITEEGAYEVRCSVCNELLDSGIIPTLDDILFSIGDGTAKFGDTVKLPVKVTNNKDGMFIVALDVVYDGAALKLVGIENGDLVADVDISASEYEAGKTRIYFENSDSIANITGDGILCYVEFEIAYDDTLANTVIDVALEAEANNVINADGVALATIFEGGEVTVEAREATITVGSVEAPFDTEVTVPVTVKNNPGMFIFTADVEYDTDVLTFVCVDDASEVFEDAYVYATEYEAGKIRVYVENVADADSMTGGVLCGLKFAVAEDDDLVGSETALTMTAVENGIINYNGNDVDNSIVDGAVTVADRAKIKVNDTSAKYGKETVVGVTVDNNEGFFISIVDVKYDTSVLDFDSVMGHIADAEVIVNEYEDGVIRIYVENTADADITVDAVLADLIFKVADNAALVGVDSVVAVEAVELVNYAGDNLDYAYVDGSVTVLDREKINAAEVTGEYAHEIEVPVSVENNVGLWGAIVEYTFDDSVVEFVGVKSGLIEVVEGESYSCNGNVVTVFGENSDLYADVTEDGVLYTLVFKAITSDASTSVDVSIVEIINAASENMADFVADNGSITTTPCTHGVAEGVVTVEPTYEATGWIEYYCKYCGEDLGYGEEIPMLVERIAVENVDAVAGDEIVVPVTLIDNRGVWAVAVTVAYDNEALEFMGVENGLFEVAKYNVTDKDGVITIYTNNAGASDVTENGAILNLKFKVAYTVAGEVALDVEKIADSTVNIAGDQVDFTMVDGVVNVTAHEHTPSAEAPTCTEGVVCTACGEVLAEANGHTEVADAAVDATCTNTGLTAGSHCEICGVTIVAQEIIPANGHSVIVDEAVTATCWQTGLTEGSHCETCGVTIVAQTVSAKLEHVVVEDAAVEADCLSTGLTAGSHCDVCGHVIVAQEVVPATGHTYEATYAWADDYSTCTITLVCACGDTQVVEATVTVETIAPEGSVDGKAIYTATYGDYTDTKEVVIPASYTLTVDGVETTVAAGTTVTLDTVRFDAETTRAFDYWVVASENVTLDYDAEVLENTFVMPAEDVEINFVTYLVGDVTGDGKVNALDSATLLNLIKEGADVTKYADIDLNDKLNALDSASLLKIIKGTYDYKPYMAD